MARPVKRSYDSSSRRAQAEALRRQIIDIAAELFVEQGYEATSMRELAAAAGVSPQTLYNAFDSKFGVFAALLDVIVAGDHEPVAVGDRPEARALADATSPYALIGSLVALGVPILERLHRIYPTLRAAAGSDPQVADAYDRFAIQGRYDDMSAVGVALESMGALPAELDATQATDIAWTILSPDTFHLLVTHRGWSPDEFAAWATATLERTIVAGGP